MTDFSQQEDTDSVHQTAPVPSEVFTTRESLRERCEMFVRCLPQAPMRDRLARLFEDLRAGEWQPIESAPKDGTVFLAMNHDGELWSTKYFDSNQGPQLAYRTNKLVETSRHRIHDVDGKKLYERLESSECWQSAWTHWSRGYEFAPTHWSPLPAAPHHRSADPERHGSDKPESDSGSSFAAQGMAQDAIRELLEEHAKRIEAGNEYAYFELAYTRKTGWVAWLTDKPARGEPGTAAYAASRKVIVLGQGDTPDEACNDALAALRAVPHQPTGARNGE